MAMTPAVFSQPGRPRLTTFASALNLVLQCHLAYTSVAVDNNCSNGYLLTRNIIISNLLQSSYTDLLCGRKFATVFMIAPSDFDSVGSFTNTRSIKSSSLSYSKLSSS